MFSFDCLGGAISVSTMLSPGSYAKYAPVARSPCSRSNALSPLCSRAGGREHRNSRTRSTAPSVLSQPFQRGRELECYCKLRERYSQSQRCVLKFKCAMRQLFLALAPARKRGGARPGAGRKRSPHSGPPHVRRAQPGRRHPVHVLGSITITARTPALSESKELMVSG